MAAPFPKHDYSRRKFLQTSASCAVLGCSFIETMMDAAEAPAESKPRKMKICLNPGMIGVRANMSQSIRLAAQYGFEAIEPNLGELAAMSEGTLNTLLEDLKSKGLVLGAAGTAVPITRPQTEFSDWLAKLPRLAAALQKAGGKRLTTWISCGDGKLTYLENFRLHAKRVAEIAGIAGDHGLSFGLEYIGPKTSWTRQRYPFIHSMREMKELIAEAGKRNVGLLLDSWHWHTAGEMTADLLTLRNEDVISVHINDAPAGVSTDQQVDNRRALPAATGVIAIGAFLGALKQIGYDGPVIAEPFDDELRRQPQAQILQRTIEAMRKAFAQVK